jgi:hypothetical protein
MVKFSAQTDTYEHYGHQDQSGRVQGKMMCQGRMLWSNFQLSLITVKSVDLKDKVEDANRKWMGQCQRLWSFFQLRLILVNILAIKVKLGEFK